MPDFYIYYNAASADAVAIERQVRLMQADLARYCGAAPQLKRRQHAGSGLDTWMEVYPATAAGFEQRLAAALTQGSLPDLTKGARHIEQFVDLPCA